MKKESSWKMCRPNTDLVLGKILRKKYGKNAIFLLTNSVIQGMIYNVAALQTLRRWRQGA